MNKFQAQFQTAYKNGEIPDFIHFYQMIDVLIIDDIEELTGKTGTQNALFNIFNHLQLAGKQLILTSIKPPVELKDIEQRLLTRFKWGLSTRSTRPTTTPKSRSSESRLRNSASSLRTKSSATCGQYLRQRPGNRGRSVGPGSQYRLYGQESFLSLVKEILKVYVRYAKRDQQSSTSSKSSATSCISTSSASIRPNEPAKWLRRVRSPYLAKQHTKSR